MRTLDQEENTNSRMISPIMGLKKVFTMMESHKEVLNTNPAANAGELIKECMSSRLGYQLEALEMQAQHSMA